MSLNRNPHTDPAAKDESVSAKPNIYQMAQFNFITECVHLSAVWLMHIP